MVPNIGISRIDVLIVIGLNTVYLHNEIEVQILFSALHIVVGTNDRGPEVSLLECGNKSEICQYEYH